MKALAWYDFIFVVTVIGAFTVYVTRPLMCFWNCLSLKLEIRQRHLERMNEHHKKNHVSLAADELRRYKEYFE